MAESADDQFILHGMTVDIQKPSKPLGTYLLEQMDTFGDRISHINGVTGTAVTFKEFRSRCILIATNMRKHGINKGDNIIMCSRNQSNAYATAIAALLVGAPFNALDVGLGPADLKHMLNLLKPKAVFCELEALPNIMRALSEIKLETKIVVYEEDSPHLPFSEFLKENPSAETFKPVEFDDLKKAVAFIVCSSGSTGMPKGVMLDHECVLGHLILLSKVELTSGSVEQILVFTTLYWISGLIVLLKTLECGHISIYIPSPFCEQLALETMEKYKPTILMLSPSMCHRLAKYPETTKYDLSSIRFGLVGGGKSSPELLSKMNDYLPNGLITVGYGMTEFVGNIAFNKNKNYDSIGKLSAGMSLKVVDLNTGKAVGANSVGEFHIRNKYVTQGYYDNPAGTAETIDKDGWVHTGDLGYYDEELNLYITDRIKEVLKYQNYPVCPAEVEIEIMSHPDVVDCGVVGVPHDIYGDLLIAFVLPAKNTTLTEDELKSYVAERVSDAKKLRGGVIFLQDIPVLPSGKVNRKYLKNKALEMKEELLAKAD